MSFGLPTVRARSPINRLRQDPKAEFPHGRKKFRNMLRKKTAKNLGFEIFLFLVRDFGTGYLRERRHQAGRVHQQLSEELSR